MKIITKFAVVALIILFPLASWYYLNTGLDYRKTALQEVKTKGKFKFTSEVGSVHLKDYTTVLFADKNLDTEMIKIYNQYKQAPGFQMIELTRDTSTTKDWDQLLVSQHVLDTIAQEENKIFLIDKDLELRKSYSNSNEDFKLLVKHIAIVIPRDIEPDIKLRTNNEGE